MKRHVLIVDDNQSDILKVSSILEKDGLVPIPAKDASAALEICQMHRLDLAIIDIHLPIVNGFKLTEELKAKTETKTLPILMMSGAYRTTEDVRAAILSGASDFILKPIDPLIMSAKIGRMLTNRIQWGEWSLADSGVSPIGFLKIEVEVLSISEMGLRILSSVPLPLHKSPQVSIPLIEDLGIPSPYLEVLECSRSGQGYQSYLTFIGVPEVHLKKIRIFCAKLASVKRAS